MDRMENIIRASEIIQKKLFSSSPLSVEEEVFLDEWLQESAAHREFYAHVQEKGIPLGDYENVTGKFDVSGHWRSVNRKIKGVSLVRRYRVAAACAVFVLASWLIFTLNRSPKPVDKPVVTAQVMEKEWRGTKARLLLGEGKVVELEMRDTVMETGTSNIRVSNGNVAYDAKHSDSTVEYNTIQVPRGGIYSLTLSDGTRVFLNSESELTFPVVFSGDRREVRLKGEGFFEVTSDSLHPFVVSTGEMKTRVLGTKFNVMAYPREAFYTTLVEGKVAVTLTGNDKSFVLKPNQQAMWQEGSTTVAIRDVDAMSYIGWRDGLLVLDEVPLDDIMKKLCRWYDMEYEYRDTLEEDYTFTGKVKQGDDLKKVLETLTLMGGPPFEIRDSVIYVGMRR